MLISVKLLTKYVIRIYALGSDGCYRQINNNYDKRLKRHQTIRILQSNSEPTIVSARQRNIPLLAFSHYLTVFVKDLSWKLKPKWILAVEIEQCDHKNFLFGKWYDETTSPVRWRKLLESFIPFHCISSLRTLHVSLVFPLLSRHLLSTESLIEDHYLFDYSPTDPVKRERKFDSSWVYRNIK